MTQTEDQTNNLPTISQAGVARVAAAAAAGNLTVMPGAPLMNLTTEAGLMEAVTQFRNMMAYRAQCVRLSVMTASSEAITDFEGSPWFAEDSLEAILALLGAEVKLVSMKIVHDTDDQNQRTGHWGAEAVAEIKHPVLGTMQGYGFAHSTDSFLGTNFDRPSRKTGRVKALDEVSQHNLRQHAFTRAKGKAARSMLGLSGLTWDQVEKLGFARGKGGKVSFDKVAGNAADAEASLTGAAKSAKAAAAKAAAKPTGNGTEAALRARFAKACTAAGYKPEEIAAWVDHQHPGATLDTLTADQLQELATKAEEPSIAKANLDAIRNLGQ